MRNCAFLIVGLLAIGFRLVRARDKNDDEEGLPKARNIVQDWQETEDSVVPLDQAASLDPSVKYPGNKPVPIPQHSTTSLKAGKSRQQGRSLVVGGSIVDKGRSPWFVLLMTRDYPGWKARTCGASLISPRHALTAAHCVDNLHLYLKANAEGVLVNAYYKPNALGMNGGQPSHFSETLNYTYPETYDPKTLKDDVAIITFKSPVKDYNVFPPIGLAEEDPRDGLVAKVFGFGRLKQNNPNKPDFLHSANLEFISNKSCLKHYGSRLTESNICAGYATGRIDACKGDSGGPLVIDLPGQDKPLQLGIVSWGDGCAQFWRPGVYTSVPKKLWWIKEQVCPNLSGNERAATPICSNFKAPPTGAPSTNPSIRPSQSQVPSKVPTILPSIRPSQAPTLSPSANPSLFPSSSNTPSSLPSEKPSLRPSQEPTGEPSSTPDQTSLSPSTSISPTQAPSSPTSTNTGSPTKRPALAAGQNESCKGRSCGTQNPCCAGFSCGTNEAWFQDMTLPSRVCRRAPSQRRKNNSQMRRPMRTSRYGRGNRNWDN